MRTRSIGLSLFATAAIIVSACSGAATPAPATTAPTDAPPASVAPTDSPTPTEPGKVWKVGVVTDVGTLDDKNFNQFSWEGAQAGAEAIGGEARPIVTQSSADYAKNIQSFLDQDYDIIVTIGFALGDATAIAAKANPDVWFIGVDHGPVPRCHRCTRSDVRLRGRSPPRSCRTSRASSSPKRSPATWQASLPRTSRRAR